MKWLIVFDMDGVLADVSRSYRAVVRETARRFLRPCPRWRELPTPLFSLDDLAWLKQGGGLNNDWDLTYRVIELLLAPLGSLQPSRHPDPWERRQRVLERLDLGPLLRVLAGSPRPLERLERRRSPAGRPAAVRSSFVRGLCRGEVGAGNLVKQIFQEIYLGAGRFQETYGIAPRVYKGQGYLERERLLAPPRLLRRLAARHLLGVATGRPQAEARYFLARFRLEPCFRRVLTLEDCQREEQRIFRREGRRVRRSKPHPFLLDTLAEGLRERVDRRCYVGDMPDDMRAALRSTRGYLPFGLVQAAPDREALRRRLLAAGARWVARDFEELARFFLDKPILWDENRSHSAIRRPPPA